MKRIIAIIIFCVLISGCQTSDRLLENQFRTDEHLQDFDVQMEYAGSFGDICKVGSVYYSRLGTWLFYHDEASNSSGKLCSKPECTHDDTTCNAYIGDAIEGIQLYDNHIYWLSNGSALYRMDLTGNNRELVRTVTQYGGMNPRFYIHRGYVYTSVVQSTVVDRKPYNTFSLIQYNLNQSDEAGVILYEHNYEMNASNYLCRLYRNKLYLMIDNDLNADRSWVKRELYEYDIASGQLELLWSDESEWYTRDMIVYENEIQILACENEGNDQHSVRRLTYNLNSNTMIDHESILVDEGYLGSGMVDGYILLHAGYTAAHHDTSQYQVYDWNGEILYEGEMEGEDLYCIGSDDTGILFSQMYTYLIDEVVTRHLNIIRIPLDFNGEEEFLIKHTEIYD